MTLKVFISYASEDREKALAYYELIRDEGATPWMDVKQILPGQNWEAEIDRALNDAGIVVLLLSKSSVNKRGFVQREAQDAIGKLRYKLPDDIYVIPLLLESCDVPKYISDKLQYIDLNMPGAWDKVRSSIHIASKQQSIVLELGTNVGPFKLFTEKLQEHWAGDPGYDIDIDYPKFQSISIEIIAKELNAYFQGRAYNHLIISRQDSWRQNNIKLTDNNLSENGRWDSFQIAYATAHFLSLTYKVGWYGAGAAHPNTHFETHNFIFFDKLYKTHLEDFFEDLNGAIKVISDVCIGELSKEFWLRTGEKPDVADIKWFMDGAGQEKKNFDAFNVHKDHFTFLFAPYQVNCYAMSTWSVDVSFYDLLSFLKPDVFAKICTNDSVRNLAALSGI